MNSLATNIEKKFLEMIRKDTPIDEFEQWVYQSKQLKEILATSDYLELISIDFKSNDAWENLYKILRGRIRVHRASKLLDLQEKVPFTDWIESIFKLPLLDYPGDIEDLMLPLPNSEIKLKYLVQLLQSPSKNLTGYTAGQIGQGLDYLFNDLFQDNHVFFDSSLDWELQKKGIRTIEILFREIFVRLADPSSPLYANSEVLDGVCLMWWDIFPSWGNPSNE
ncbi:MAG: hypothetical protein GY702_07060 [Desulfobulbaceae bacterium]|nr:hypothetical protein [Desulfobulbaceae bacterium]